MMEKHDGAALLLVLSIVPFVSAFMLHLWFVGCFYYDLAVEREACYKTLYVTDTLLKIGLLMVCDRFDHYQRTIIKRNDVSTIDYSSLVALCGGKKEWNSWIHVFRCSEKRSSSSLCVHATLFDQHHCLCQLRCLLTRVAQRHDGKGTVQYVVSHYTIGTPV